jgi:hypothetical protein
VAAQERVEAGGEGQLSFVTLFAFAIVAWISMLMGDLGARSITIRRTRHLDPGWKQ